MGGQLTKTFQVGGANISQHLFLIFHQIQYIFFDTATIILLRCQIPVHLFTKTLFCNFPIFIGWWAAFCKGERRLNLELLCALCTISLRVNLNLLV